MVGGLESRCVGRVYGADGAVHSTIRTVHTTYAAAVKTTLLTYLLTPWCRVLLEKLTGL